MLSYLNFFSYLKIFFLFKFFILIKAINKFENDFQDLEIRIAISPRKKDCFYQFAKKNFNLEVSYQVINSKLSWMNPLSDASNLQIDFELFDPNHKLIIKEENSKEGTHVHTVLEEGVYSFCFDNNISNFANKIINLEIYLYSDQDEDRWGDKDFDFQLKNEEKYSDSIKTLKSSLNKIKDSLIKISHSQNAKKAIESRDFNIITSLSSFINSYSTFSLIMLPLVGFFQIMLIRSLFEQKSHWKCLFKPLPFIDYFSS